MKISRIVSLALAVVAAGCAEGTGPGSEDGTYALVDVEGVPLPVRVGSETWLADTIRIDRGDWARVSVVRLHGEGTGDEPVRRETDGFVRRDGSRIVLDFFCPPDALALCVAPDTVYAIAGQLVRSNNRYGQESDDDPLFRYGEVR